MSDEYELNKMPRVYKSVTDNQAHVEFHAALDDIKPMEFRMTATEAASIRQRYIDALKSEPPETTHDVQVPWQPLYDEMRRGALVRIGEDTYVFQCVVETTASESGIIATLRLTPFSLPTEDG
jgi:hypothetical protein